MLSVLSAYTKKFSSSYMWEPPFKKGGKPLKSVKATTDMRIWFLAQPYSEFPLEPLVLIL